MYNVSHLQSQFGAKYLNNLTTKLIGVLNWTQSGYKKKYIYVYIYVFLFNQNSPGCDF